MDDKALTDEALEKHRHIVQVVFREEFEAGQKLALLDCFLWCDRYRLAVPAWACSEMAAVAQRYIDDKFLGQKSPYTTLDAALFGTKVKHGRHAKAVTERREKFQRQMIFDLVEALKRKGYEGDALWRKAQEALGAVHVSFDQALSFTDTPDEKLPATGTIRNDHGKIDREGEGAKPPGLGALIPLLIGIPDADE